MLFLNPFLQHEMKIAIYIGKGDVDNDPGIVRLMEELRIGGHELYVLADKVLLDEADMLLSVGGDGTFLSASMLVAGRGIPVVGVNSGRLGFLSENRPADVVQALLSGEYSVEHRAMLEAEVHTGESSIDSWP